MSKEYSMKRVVESILNCTKCQLCKYRRKPVPGEGPLDTEIMLIGEAPGASEDEEGRPFVGAAGKLLTELLEKNNISRSSVYITNIVKCRPPGNRDPEESEINACLPYLIEQISIIKPKIIVTLGRHAGRVIYKLMGKSFQSMSREHGRVVKGVIRQLGLDVTVIPTYHPAAALYKPDVRRILEEDFKKIRSLITSSKTISKSGSITLDVFLKKG
ncbi:MAG TPA: uracil-DNA glycosylase [Desulfurococcales archaeon]|nr:uracil-DNA glycosylase [Desulfurococcales archaeon]